MEFLETNLHHLLSICWSGPLSEPFACPMKAETLGGDISHLWMEWANMGDGVSLFLEVLCSVRSMSQKESSVSGQRKALCKQEISRSSKSTVPSLQHAHRQTRGWRYPPNWTELLDLLHVWKQQQQQKRHKGLTYRRRHCRVLTLTPLASLSDTEHYLCYPMRRWPIDCGVVIIGNVFSLARFRAALVENPD